MKNKKLSGYIAGCLASSLMASLGIFVRNISANEQIITFARFALGFIFLTSYLLLSKKIKGLNKISLSFPLLSSGTLIALCILSYIKAINTTSLANAVFLLYLGPLIATGLAAIFLKETLTRPQLISLCMGFVGCLFILEFNVSLNRVDYLGYFWGTLSAIFYGLYIVVNRKITQEINSLVRAFYQLLCGAITVIPFLGAGEVNWEYTDLYWLIAIGFFQGFLALTLMTFAVRRLEAHEYGIVAYLEPLIATLLGLFFYSEPISGWQSIGCIIIFLMGVKQVFYSHS